jgi:hypothetical protein
MDDELQAVELALVPYRQHLNDFVSGMITADDIEPKYLRLFSDDPTPWPEDVFRTLEDFFFAVDDNVADDDLATRSKASTARSSEHALVRRLNASTHSDGASTRRVSATSRRISLARFRSRVGASPNPGSVRAPLNDTASSSEVRGSHSGRRLTTVGRAPRHSEDLAQPGQWPSTRCSRPPA